MAKDKVRWGVISTANIGVAKVIPGMMKSKDIEIRAIASRSLPTAKKAAKKPAKKKAKKAAKKKPAAKAAATAAPAAPKPVSAPAAWPFPVAGNRPN